MTYNDELEMLKRNRIDEMPLIDRVNYASESVVERRLKAARRGTEAIQRAVAEVIGPRITAGEMVKYYLEVFLHAHQTGNSVPPDIENGAREAISTWSARIGGQMPDWVTENMSMHDAYRAIAAHVDADNPGGVAQAVVIRLKAAERMAEALRAVIATWTRIATPEAFSREVMISHTKARAALAAWEEAGK